MYTADEIANWFIANKDCMPDNVITNMKLQKLLYYAQGTFLALTDEPLFQDDIRKWKFGSVVPSIWRKYKSFDDQPITEECTAPEVTETESFLLHKVCEPFAVHSAWQLSEMTHQERSWKIAQSQSVIKNDTIKDYFKKHVFVAMLSNEIFDTIPVLEGRLAEDGKTTIFPAKASI
jgi:uncharacterized phage-associated protein